MSALFENVQETLHFLKTRTNLTPTVGLILGSGLGGLTELMRDKVSIDYAELPHFPRATVAGHAGQLVDRVRAGARRVRPHHQWLPVLPITGSRAGAEAARAIQLSKRHGSAVHHQGHVEHGRRRGGGRQEDHGARGRQPDANRRSETDRDAVAQVHRRIQDPPGLSNWLHGDLAWCQDV